MLLKTWPRRGRRRWIKLALLRKRTCNDHEPAEVSDEVIHMLQSLYIPPAEARWVGDLMDQLELRPLQI